MKINLQKLIKTTCQINLKMNKIKKKTKIHNFLILKVK